MALAVYRQDEQPGDTTPRPRWMPLGAVADAHRAEMSKRQRGQPFSDAFGVELFRRAVAERDSCAWEAVVQQYYGLVKAWVRGHPAYAASRTDADEVVMCAFARFWAAIGPERSAQFVELAALMRYLKLCTHSVLLDEVRARARMPESPVTEHDAEDVAFEHDSEAVVVDRLSAVQLWLVMTRALEDEAERLVIYLSFVLDLKPGTIHERYPDRFGSVAEVYRIKRNAIDRLRRSAEIRALVGQL
jgi:DNA-directed RNA polymerase specialized sigma24 family protein